MRITLYSTLAIASLWFCGNIGAAQSSSESGADQFVARMLAFDKNQDGRLTRKELTDTRLHRLFDRVDANRDDVVTERELREFYRRESAGFAHRHGLPGLPEGHEGPFAGQVIPEDIQQDLGLTGEQRDQLLALQRDVDIRLKSLLTEKQQNRLRGFRTPSPGANGFRGSPDIFSPKPPR